MTPAHLKNIGDHANAAFAIASAISTWAGILAPIISLIAAVISTAYVVWQWWKARQRD